MPVRNVKYDKSSMLQRDLPNANFICTDGDGLKFNPSTGDDNVNGLACLTHHPQESNSVLWNSVKLDWTRQAIGYNILDPNQANACEDGTTTGFGINGAGATTLTATTEEHYERNYSLKVVTPGTGINEGIATVPGKDIVTGNTYSAKARVKGSGTIVIAISERDSNDVFIGDTASSPVTLTSSWQEISVSRVCSTGTKVRMKVYTNSAQAATFYVDKCQINEGNPAPWVPGTGSFQGRYNILDSNQSNACEDGTTNGFRSWNNVTLSPDSTQHYTGSYSLKVTTSGTQTAQGMGTSPKPAVIGQKYSGKVRVKGASGTIYVSLYEVNSDGTWIRTIINTWTTPTTLNGTWQEINISGIPTTGEYIQLAVRTATDVAQAITFYVDTLQINAGDPAPWVEGPASDFKVTTSLLGLTDDGEESIIGEKIITTCPTTETNETLSFDLSKSACQTSFTRESGTATSGKIQLNLPKRYSNYESITLDRIWLDGWSKCKVATITGSSYGTFSSYQLPLTISYDSDMQSDFRDIRFMVWNGQQLIHCYYWLSYYVPSSVAYFTVLIPTIPASPATMKLFCFYGNSSATSVSNGDNVFIFYDSFDDNSINTNKWQIISGGGSAIVNETNYELQVRGDGSNRSYARTKNTYAGNYILEFLAKKSENIEVALHWDGNITGIYDEPLNGYLFRYVGWDTTNRLELVKYSGGSLSVLASYAFTLDNTYHAYTIHVAGGWISCYIDGVPLFSVHETTWNQGYLGFSARETPNAVNAYYDVVRVRQYAANPPTITAWSDEESTHIILPDICDWNDNFEDGRFNARTQNSKEWINQAGTTAIESSTPISGSYSLKHTGSGTGVQNDIASINDASSSYTVEFDAQVKTQGSLQYTPYLYLWFNRFVDANNWIRVDTYWDSVTSKQKLRLIKMETGTPTVIQSYDWKTSKLPVGEIHHFKINDTGSHMSVWVDSTLLLDTDYTTTVPVGIKGVGCPQDTVGLFDNFEFIHDKNVHGNLTSINFTTPSDWSANSYSYLNFKEYDGFNITTRSIPLSVQNTAFLGYNGLDAFNALRLKIESECNDDYTFKFNNFEYKYEI